MKRLLLIPALIALAVSAASAEKKIIYPDDFRPNMPFSPGVLVDGTLYCAGQTGGDLKTGEYAAAFEDEVHQTFKRIGIILVRQRFLPLPSHRVAEQKLNLPVEASKIVLGPPVELVHELRWNAQQEWLSLCHR